MSNHSHIKSRAAGGAALVALSGFVPQPLISTAHAATATINVTGSFISGITLTAGQDAKFGSVVASGANGKLVISTAGVVTPSKATAIGGTPKAGNVAFKAVSTAPNVDITVKGLGALTLKKTVGGHAVVGTAKLDSVTIHKIGAAATILAGAATAKKAGYNITKKTATILVGATVSWGATAPIGAFTAPVTFTISY